MHLHVCDQCMHRNGEYIYEYYKIILFLANICDTSKCYFDTDCPFPKVCQNQECIKDENVIWTCSGAFVNPRIACKKRIFNRKLR